MIGKILKWKAEQRTSRMVSFLLPWLEKDQSVLDFGAGDMSIAEAVQKAIQVKIQGIDVMDVNKTKLPFQTFDGRHIPFEDRSFDVTYAISVLHHIDDQSEMLKECLRVTKKRLLIHEDIYENWFELQIVKIWDYVFNKILYPEMNFPFTFRKTGEWVKFFKSEPRVKDVKVVSVKPDPLRPTRHALFIIDLTN